MLNFNIVEKLMNSYRKELFYGNLFVLNSRVYFGRENKE